MTPPDAAGASPQAPPGPGARFWEAGWTGSPTRAAACVRGLLVLAFTLAGLLAVAVQRAHSGSAGAAAFWEVAPAGLVAAVAMVLVLYWLHGSPGQVFLFLFAALLTGVAGGFALSGAVFAARGTVSAATVGTCSAHTDFRAATWWSCPVTLADGTALAEPIGTESPRSGRHATVTYDPAGLAAPAFGDRTRPDLALLVTTGAGLLLTAGSIAAATWHGERRRLRGRPSLAETHNPHYYPRRRSSPDYGSRA